MTTVAIPHWQGRISPVFDVATRLLVVEVENGRETSRSHVELDSAGPGDRVALLGRRGVEVLICGAISRPLEEAIAQVGIELRARLCGEIECVLQSYLAGDLADGRFLMPGCCGRRGGPGPRGRRRGRRRKEQCNHEPPRR